MHIAQGICDSVPVDIDVTMDDRGWRWTDAHFCSLPSQTNVYGLTKITESEGNNKLLVASLDGKVIAVEYQSVGSRLTPCTKEIQFTYIPGDAEIVSVDVLRRCHGSKGIIVGITFLKLQEDEKESKPACQFLNLYSASETGDEANLDIVAQGCKSLELNFIPYQLTHTELVDGSWREMIFLLSGGDHRIHMYREAMKSHGFQETSTDDFFPEFEDIQSSVLKLSIQYLDNYDRRLTVMGHHNGLVKVAFVDVGRTELLQTWTTEHDSPVTSIQLFTSKNHVACPSFLDVFNDEGILEEKDNKITELSLLVTSALEPAVVYRNILISGFEDSVSLPNSEMFDSTLCSCVVDIDFDGENELLVGTYGQELLAYKYFEENQQVDVDRKYSQTENSKTDFSQSNNYNLSQISPDEKLNPLEEFNKQRHRSGESNSPTTSFKDTQLPRKARSQEDLSLSQVRTDQEEEEEDNLESLKQPAGYRILWQRSFPGPVVGLDRLDIMGDGMDDLVVVTLKGMHILQPDLEEVADVCRERLRGLCDSTSEADDAYLDLQQETFGR